MLAMKLTIKKDFKVFPHFLDTDLYKLYQGEFTFQKNKVNVLVGPNGSGKSTLLNILSLLSFSTEIGYSRACKEYLEDKYWGSDDKYRQWSKEVYLPGVEFSEGFCPALSFKPNRIPGNESSVVSAMMVGYFDEARSYADQTENKSSGQSISAQLQLVRDHLACESKLTLKNSDAFSLYPHEEADLREYSSPSRSSRKKLLQLRSTDFSHNLLLLDEPDQSTDVRSNFLFWKFLQVFKPTNTTVIVASHSPYALRPGFNLISCSDGYLDELSNYVIPGLD